MIVLIFGYLSGYSIYVVCHRESLDLKSSDLLNINKSFLLNMFSISK